MPAEFDAEGLVRAVRAEIDPDTHDLADALFHAIGHVAAYPTASEVRYFGGIGGGYFFSGATVETARWYPDTDIRRAISRLRDEFGDEYVRGI